MKTKVLYFPYIRVPNSVWMTRVLLYWDSIGTIVPFDFIRDPDNLDLYTRDLIKANLVTQVIPGMYIQKIPLFAKAFEDYLVGLGPELDRRRSVFQRRLSSAYGLFDIHIEKLGNVDQVLMDAGLAKMREYPWFSVEPATARDFMAYLAAALGHLERLGFMPVTDEEAYLSNFILSGSPDIDPERKISQLRLQLTERLFPAPVSPPTVTAIELFKMKHGQQLGRFRLYVEYELGKIAAIDDQALRNRQMELFQQQVQEEINDICEKMRDSGWQRLVFGKLCAVVSAVPGTPFIFGLASALYNVFSGPQGDWSRSPLLYAAFARKSLFKYRVSDSIPTHMIGHNRPKWKA